VAPDVDHGAVCTCHWNYVGSPEPVGGCVVLATEVTPGLLTGAEPDADQFYVTMVYRWDDRMEANSKQYHSNSKTRLGMHR
jgi:hypothetical protein